MVVKMDGREVVWRAERTKRRRSCSQGRSSTSLPTLRSPRSLTLLELLAFIANAMFKDLMHGLAPSPPVGAGSANHK